MARTKIVGNAAVITSTVTLENIKKIEKSTRADALVLKGGEDGKTPIFAVASAPSGNGSLNSVGAEFANASRDANGFAQITLSIPSDVTDAKEYVADKYGAALTNLAAVEAKLPEVVQAINAEHTALLNTIEQVDTTVAQA